MNTRTIVALAGALCLGEIGSAVIIWKENYPDAQPCSPWFSRVYSCPGPLSCAAVESSAARFWSGCCVSSS